MIYYENISPLPAIMDKAVWILSIQN